MWSATGFSLAKNFPGAILMAAPFVPGAVLVAPCFLRAWPGDARAVSR